MTAADIVRLVVSLVLVVGGLFVLRWWSQRGRGRSLRRPTMVGRVPIRVIGRAGLARGASVAVIEVGTQRFLVGASEHSVSLLSELPISEHLESRAPASAPRSQPSGEADADAGFDLAGGDVAIKLLDSSDGPLHSFTDAPSSFTDAHSGPRMGLVARLQQMTLRAPDRRPSRAVS